MNKLITLLLGLILTPLFIFVCIINLINFFAFHNLFFTLNFNLIFFKNDYSILKFGIILTLFNYFYIFLAVFSSKNNKNQIKDKKTRKEKNEYSCLLTKRQAKKGTTRVEFNKKGILRFGSYRYFFDKRFNGIKKFLNRFLSHDKKFNTIKVFNFNDKPKITRSGIPIVTYKNRVYVDSENNHSLIIGTTNSGKTYSIILILIFSTIMSKENLVINDVKGELYQASYSFLKENGYNIIALNYIEPKKSAYHNSLSLVISKYREAYLKYKYKLLSCKNTIIEMIDNLDNYDMVNFLFFQLPEPNFSESAEALSDISNKISLESKNEKDAFWNDSTGDLIEGLILILLEEYSIIDGQKIFLKDDLINFLSVKLLSEMVTKESDNVPSRLSIFIKRYRKPTDLSTLRLATIINSPKNTLGSIMSVFGRVMKKLLINDDVMKMMAKSTFDLTNLDNELTAIFIIIHDEKDTFHNLVSIIIQQIYETLIKLARRNPGNQLRIPMNIIWDEFANGSKWENITNALTASRSRNIRFYLAIQDYGQLEYLYKEKAKTIRGNVMNIIFLLSSDNQTNKEISELADKKLVYNKAHNNYEEKPVISTSTLKRLGLGYGVVLRQRRNPYITKFTPFNKYNFYKYIKKLDKKHVIPKERELDKIAFANILKGKNLEINKGKRHEF